MSKKSSRKKRNPFNDLADFWDMVSIEQCHGGECPYCNEIEEIEKQKASDELIAQLMKLPPPAKKSPYLN